MTILQKINKIWPFVEEISVQNPLKDSEMLNTVFLYSFQYNI